jgi:sortase A
MTLLIVGAFLLGYVGTQYLDMYLAQKSLATEWQNQASAATKPGQQVGGTTQELIRLQIPKIKLDAIVLEGATSAELSKGPGHLEQTPIPGEAGNSVITAHRDTFFRHIFELNSGDKIMVRRNGETFHYEVTGKKIVSPDDLSVLQPTPDSQLTLITCYPTYYIGPAPQRLVVLSRLVE